MLKKLFRLACVALALTLMLFAVSCTEEASNTDGSQTPGGGEHTEHTYGDYVTVLEPTCGEAGMEKRVCKECGEEDVRTVPSTDKHDFGDWKTTLEASCVKDGVQERICTACGKRDEEALPTNENHSFGEWNVTVQPTCGETGERERGCVACGHTETETVEPTGKHSFGEWDIFVEATCATEGAKRRVCQVCYHKEGGTVPKTDDHDFGNFEIEVYPTCKDEGKQVRICNRCDKHDEQTIPTTNDHSYGEWQTTTEPTCSAAGVKEQKCTVCGHTETEAVEPTGDHSYGEWQVTTEPTCGVAGVREQKCTVCGHTATEAVDPTGAHSFGEWQVTTEPTCGAAGVREQKCTVCGRTETETVEPTGNHSFGEWNVTLQPTCGEAGVKEQKCTVCGHTATEAVEPTGNHSFGEWDIFVEATCATEGAKRRVCQVCYHKESGTVPKTDDHDFGDFEIEVYPTCKDEGKEVRRCIRCDKPDEQTIPTTNDHSYGEWQVTTEPTCADSGEKARVCTVCGHTETATVDPTGNHSFGEWQVTTEPTCGAAGVKEQKCTVCGHTATETLEPTGNHSFGEFEVDYEPVCTDPGQESRACSVCGEVDSREIPAVGGHKLENWQVYDAGWCDREGEEIAYCENFYYCGYYETRTTPALGHNYREDYYCERCGDYLLSWGLEYELSEDGTYYTVVGIGVCEETDITIPPTHNGYGDTEYLPVKYIAMQAFKDNRKITSLTIIHDLEGIHGEAFLGCWYLKEISFAEDCSIGFISSRAFKNCSSLTKVVLPAKVGSVGSSLFSGCGALTSMTVPWLGYTTEYDSLKFTLGYYFGSSSYSGGVKTTQEIIAASGSIANTSYYIPKALKHVTVLGGTVYHGAFYNCSNLESVTFGAGVTAVQANAFYGCTALKAVHVSDMATWLNIDFETADSNPLSLESVEGLYIDGTLVEDVVTPEGVTQIKNYAFNKYKALKSIVISDGVTRIGINAFESCIALESVTIGEGVLKIENEAFSKTASLSEIKYNAIYGYNLKAENKVFYEAGYSVSGITLTIGKNVTEIPAYLFNPVTVDEMGIYAPRIYSVVFEDGSACKTIGAYAFYKVRNLTVLTIPESVEAIGKYAFADCWLLREIYYNAACVADFAEKDYPFQRAGYYSEKIALVIGNQVERIPAYIFGSYAYIKTVTFEEGSVCESIGRNAFYSISVLKSVIIPASMKCVDALAFNGCANVDIRFEVTEGWYYTAKETDTEGTPLTVAGVEGDSVSLTDYYGRYWKHD